MTIRVLDGNGSLALEDVLYQCRELMEDTDFPTVRRWRDMYRLEMACQVVHDSLHDRPGWTQEYLLTSAGRPVGSVTHSGPPESPLQESLFGPIAQTSVAASRMPSAPASENCWSQSASDRTERSTMRSWPVEIVPPSAGSSV